MRTLETDADLILRICVFLLAACFGCSASDQTTPPSCGADGACQVSTCSRRTCPAGCCDALGSCQPGTGAAQCGGDGSSCQNCAQHGEQCARQQCAPVPTARACNAQTCPGGCCDTSGNCQPGSLNAACGDSGNACQNCALAGLEQCIFQQCEVASDSGACSALTCPGGCCDSSGQCEQGVVSLACGTLGTNCQNCLGSFERCSSTQQCVPSANDGGLACSQSCTGCCDTTGSCQEGSLDTQCGQNGAPCQDCSMLSPASTCDGNPSPRLCASQRMPCPGSYPNCPPSLQEVAPTRQQVCSTADLQYAASVCADGASATTPSCDSFFGCSNTACAACLKQFDFNFVDQIGIRTCVVPFVDATCNHNSACISDCTAETCFLCTDDALSSCETQVQTGTCATYTQADQCVVQALAGPAAVCNPVTYQGNFGAWLQGVGAKYCGLP